ncbi:MAG: hypothetical protein A3F17_05305 [Gammaproteobacteria bacterium RIFCSPHIGHO2_12_FULL_41_15]|nr:MAG: hypothetical protein A3F17_05305 [Gammaproteobacteria bacterium RIFCSPHIGHO2_12_FULL_41_15]
MKSMQKMVIVLIALIPLIGEAQQAKYIQFPCPAPTQLQQGTCLQNCSGSGIPIYGYSGQSSGKDSDGKVVNIPWSGSGPANASTFQGAGIYGGPPTCGYLPPDKSGLISIVANLPYRATCSVISTTSLYLFQCSPTN